MKLDKGVLVVSIAFAFPFFTSAQTSATPAASDVSIVERGQHHQVWRKLTLQTNELGEVSYHTNSFVQLATGLNRQRNGQWVESTPEIVIDGNRALARGAGHEAIFAGNANSRNAIQIKTPDGLWLKGRVFGIAYHDVASGTNVLIAELKDSAGQLVGTNLVRYPDAFTDIKGVDVEYTYKKSGISQCIVFRGSPPPAPEEYGLNPERTRLLVLTEFTEFPNPTVRKHQWAAETERVEDETISFGNSMKMGRGQAFEIKNGVPGKRRADVMKRWQNLEGRNFIIEEVRWQEMKRGLQSLPQGALSVTNGTASINRKTRWFAAGTLPVGNAVKEPNEPAAELKFVKLAIARPDHTSPSNNSGQGQLAAMDTGFVLDWEFVYDIGWWDFWCGNTYVVDGTVHITEAAFEPGSVIKYMSGASLWVDQFTYFYGGNCNGTAYTILTSVNDDQYGDWVYGSTGYPVPGDYGPALVVQASELAACQANIIDLYGDPGITSTPATVHVTASDSIATKGTADVGKFVIAREGGDWSQPLPVTFSVAGTATAGTDYTSIGTTATIPQDVGIVEVTVSPASQSGTIYDGTVILTLQSGSGYTVDSPSSAIVTIYDPSVPPPSGVAAPSGLVAWWRGENNALDSVAVNHGTLLNGVGFSYGKSAQGFSFDGVDDRVTVNDNAVLDIGANADYSIETWIKPQVASSAYGVQTIVDKRYTPNDWTATGYTLHLVNGQLGCQMAVGGSAANFGVAGPDLRDGLFHHVAVTVDRDSTTGGKLYVDGTAVLTFNPTGKQGDLSNTQPFRIGNHASASLSAHMTGVIDEVSLYNRALTATEIQDIHNTGRGGKVLPDVDTDGLPDVWETSYWGNTTSQSGSDDADGDGLTNLQEYQIGPNPTLADTGSTGTSDAYKDSDGDGLTNLEELKLGRNPLLPNVASPNFSPVGRSYATPQNVTITSPTAGSTIRYTLDGDEPTQADPQYTTPISFNSINNWLPTPLKAKAWKAGWTPSDTENQTYVIEAEVITVTPPTVTVSPSGSLSLLASDSIEFLVEADDEDGTITKVQLYRGNYKVAETSSSPLRYTVASVPSGTYTFTAKAIDDFGAVTLSSPVTLTIAASGPVVSLVGVQPFFTSSPGMLIARITGVNPGGLSTLTLNGGAVTKRTGEFTIPVALTEGENTFTLLANGTASATTKVYLDSTAPVIAITAPADSSSFNTTRVNVSGTFTESSLKQITVNGVLAFITGSGTFEALNVPLVEDANTITATIGDIAGNTASDTISVTGGATPVDPVQLTASTVGGFETLSVQLTPAASVPGTIQRVEFDFDGDGASDQNITSSPLLDPVSHNYTAGEYFPVVTVQTTAGRFSCLGGWNSTTTDRLRINVQSAPTTDSTITIPDPVDLKTAANGHLFVLSRSTRTIKEYDSSPTEVRSLTSIGTSSAAPTGLDVDADGNIYVALSGDHKVAKYKLVSGSYTLDTDFGSGGFIGSSGTGNGQFNTPYDVTVSSTGDAIYVSDTLNHRIQKFGSDGTFFKSIGTAGSGFGQLSNPKGIHFDPVGALVAVDSGNSRLVKLLADEFDEIIGSVGTLPGQYQSPLNVSLDVQRIYVADTGNNRIQKLDGQALNPVLQVSSELGLNQPSGIAIVNNQTVERVYIADTGNNRVLLVTIPKSDPLTTCWDIAKANIISGNITTALAHFSSATADSYRKVFTALGPTKLSQNINAIGMLTPISVRDDEARYYFASTIDGQEFIFIVTFVRENGLWRIRSF